MKKPENVIMHFENNNTAENHQLCTKCNGGCCRHYSGAYGPWQLFDNPEDITPEAIANLLKKTEEYVLDCYEGYSEEHDNGWFIRPPHKPNVPWAGSPFEMDMFGLEALMLFRDMFGLNDDNPYVDCSFGGECIHFIDKVGCKLSYDERPVMCQALVAEENQQCANGFSKKVAADWWSDYHHIIDEALDLIDDEND